MTPRPPCQAAPTVQSVGWGLGRKWKALASGSTGGSVCLVRKSVCTSVRARRPIHGTCHFSATSDKPSWKSGVGVGLPTIGEFSRWQEKHSRHWCLEIFKKHFVVLVFFVEENPPENRYCSAAVTWSVKSGSLNISGWLSRISVDHLVFCRSVGPHLILSREQHAKGAHHNWHFCVTYSSMKLFHVCRKPC